MERFTEKLEDGRNILRKGYRSCVEYGFVNYVDGEAIEKLSRYEDLEEKIGRTLDECAEVVLDKIVSDLEREKEDFHGGSLQTVYYWKGIDRAIEVIKNNISGNTEATK